MMEMTARIISYLDSATDKVLVEGFAYGARGRGVGFQYGAGWIVREALVLNSIPYLDVPPSVVKKFATNNGQAKKEAMILPIFKKWKFEHESDDVRDAYVLARIGYSMYFQDNLLEYEKEVLKKIKKI
ncbi:hypothetical protein NSQ62_08285 [Solibacillus sp. FSL H8-0523]|uniref:hypothetical protein n=1 Tax=Solibacillus sp. FSL H8-0523 TaxID=2954511 RepID=UPI003100ECE3